MITEPIAFLGATIEQTGVASCVESADAEATVTATGGWGNYTYLWSNGSTSNVLSNVKEGTYTVVVTDGEGCQVEREITLTFDDNINPTIVCPANISTYVDEGKCGAIVTFDEPSYGDNCEGASIMMTAGLPSGSLFPVGLTTVAYKVTDASGNFAVCSFTVRVTDNEKPAITCPQDINVGVDEGVCGAVINFELPAVTDNCGELTAVQTSGLPSGSLFPVGTTTNSFSVTDDAGNVSTCSFSVTVTDDEDPKITCPENVNLFTDAGKNTASGVVLGNAIATDNCNVTVTNNAPESGIYPMGITIVTWTATDNAGNSVSCEQTVTVKDNEDPIFSTCLTGNDQTVNMDAGKKSYTHSGTSWDAVATDNDAILSLTYVLTGATTGTGSSLNGVSFKKGVTTVTWTAVDKSENSSTCEYNVTVIDREVPVYSECMAGSDQTVNNDKGVSTYTHMGTAWDAVATDNDEIESITYQLSGVTTGTGTTLNNVVFNLGVTTVTWTAKDLSGNKSICVFKVDVRDKENPIIDNCIDNQRVNTITGTKVYTHKGTSWDITATDNDRVIHLSYELSGATTGGGLSLDGVSFNMGVTTVKWIAVDVAENISTCIFTVTVSDKEVPVIANCVSNQSVNTITGKKVYTHVGESWDADASDNDQVASLEYVLSGVTTGSGTTLDGVTFNMGVTTVTWTAVDKSGNQSTCIYTVTVSDKEVPVIANCVSNQSVNTITGTKVYTHKGENWDADASDNDQVASLEYVLSGVTTGKGTTLDGVTFNMGVTTVTWTAVDRSGNQSTCIFTVTVIDGEDPVFANCVESRSAATILGTKYYVHQGESWDAEASDNVRVVSLDYVMTGATTGSGTTLDGVTFNVGTTTVTWTAVDQSENSSTCIFTVIITLSNQSPTAVDDIFNTPEDVQLVANVTANDTDPDPDDVLSVVGFKIGTKEYMAGETANIDGVGSVKLNANGSITFIPVANYNGAVPVINYTINDKFGVPASANVTITVTPVNDPPVAKDDNYTAEEQKEFAANVTDNDSDVDTPETKWSVRLISTVSHGKLVLNADGTFTYTSDYDYIGEDQFVYELCDNESPSLCDQATVTIEVGPNDDCELFVPNAFSPDGDGINEYLKVRCIYNYPDAELSVYTRAGIKIFEKKNYGNEDMWGSEADAWWWATTDNKWNVGGEKVATGTYVYILKLNDPKNTILKGTVFVSY